MYKQILKVPAANALGTLWPLCILVSAATPDGTEFVAGASTFIAHDGAIQHELL